MPESNILNKREALRIALMKMLHGLVSPYDLSEHSMKMQWLGNPHFRSAVERVADFIESKTNEP